MAAPWPEVGTPSWVVVVPPPAPSVVVVVVVVQPPDASRCTSAQVHPEGARIVWTPSE